MQRSAPDTQVIKVVRHQPKRLQVFSEQCSPKSGNSISEKQVG